MTTPLASYSQDIIIPKRFLNTNGKVVLYWQYLTKHFLQERLNDNSFGIISQSYDYS
jgi:hypothetical protein